MEDMSWVLYALLGTQIVLILLAARGVYYLVEIRFAPRMDPDRTLSMVERQTEALVKELRKIEDRIANDGQVRNELLRKLLEKQARYES